MGFGCWIRILLLVIVIVVLLIIILILDIMRMHSNNNFSKVLAYYNTVPTIYGTPKWLIILTTNRIAFRKSTGMRSG